MERMAALDPEIIRTTHGCGAPRYQPEDPAHATGVSARRIPARKLSREGGSKGAGGDRQEF